MTNPELTVPVDDFLVMRRPPLTEAMTAQTAARDALTAKVVDAVEEPPSPKAMLSGSFVYAHPPDYRGRPTLRYTVDDWRVQFREFKELGIHIAILQAAAWVDFEECYYPSELFGSYKTWNVVEPMLAAAAAEHMTVYLGAAGLLYTDIELGITAGDRTRPAACARRELACYRELLDRYKGQFHGYYLVPETGYSPDPDGRLVAGWHPFFERVTNGVKELTPELPILTSPWTSISPGQEGQAIDFLTRLHKLCPITAFAPQDSIGTFSNLGFLERGIRVWREVCANTGAELWMNCESFSITNFGGPVCTIVAADFERFAVQLATAKRLGAKQLVTWEAGHFLDPHGDARARKLRAAYLASRRKALEPG